MKPWRRPGLIIVCALMVGISGTEIKPVFAAEADDYRYYHKGSLVSLTPSKRFIAMEDGSRSLSSVVQGNQLTRDPLSNREALRGRSLILYRAPRPKKGDEKAVNLADRISFFSESTGGVVQPVFEQGGAILIPTDEVVVGFRQKTSLSEALAYLTPYRDSQGILDIRSHRADTVILKIENPSDGRVFPVARFLARLNKVAFAEPNPIVIIRSEDPEAVFPGLIEKSLDAGGPVIASGEEAPRATLADVPDPPGPGWTILAQFDGESGLIPEGWQVTAAPGHTLAGWGPTTHRARTGSGAFYCAALGDQGVAAPGPAPINMVSDLQSPAYDLTGYAEVYVELWFHSVNEIAVDLQDQLFPCDFPVLYAVNGGTWEAAGEPLAIVADNGDCTLDPTTSNGWRKLLFRVPPYYRVASTMFIIRYVSDATIQMEGAYIDDFRVVGAVNVDMEPVSVDPYSTRQYELRNSGQIAGLVTATGRTDMHIPEAWALVAVSPDILVAVIDNGVETAHPDLNLVNGFDFTGAIGGAPRGEPRGSHGTGCAGNIGAIRDNGIGVAGTAPGVPILPVYSGETIGDCALAIDVAVANGAKVLNNSWGWVGFPSADIENAVTAALAAGRVVLFAAGNGPDRPPWSYEVNFPGILTGTTDVICVGASSPTDEHKGASSSDGIHAWGSSYEGAGPDVVAPGTWSYTTDLLGAEGRNDGTAIDPADPVSADYTPSFGGTSSATPKVAGVVALMLSANPALLPAEIKRMLRETADDIDTPGEDDKTGAGRVNAFRAVSAVQGGGVP